MILCSVKRRQLLKYSMGVGAAMLKPASLGSRMEVVIGGTLAGLPVVSWPAGFDG